MQNIAKVGRLAIEKIILSTKAVIDRKRSAINVKKI